MPMMTTSVWGAKLKRLWSLYGICSMLIFFSIEIAIVVNLKLIAQWSNSSKSDVPMLLMVSLAAVSGQLLSFEIVNNLRRSRKTFSEITIVNFVLALNVSSLVSSLLTISCKYPGIFTGSYSRVHTFVTQWPEWLWILPLAICTYLVHGVEINHQHHKCQNGISNSRILGLRHICKASLLLFGSIAMILFTFFGEYFPVASPLLVCSGMIWLFLFCFFCSKLFKILKTPALTTAMSTNAKISACQQREQSSAMLWHLILIAWITANLFLYPVIYMLAATRVISGPQTLAAFALINLLMRVVLSLAILIMRQQESDSVQADLDRQLSANEAKRTYLRSVFHDVRVPLNSMVMGLELLEEADGLTDGDKEVILMMQESCTFMGDTLNNVLSMEKIEAGAMVLELAPCSLQRMIVKVRMAMLGHATGKCVNIVLDIAADVPRKVIGDVHKIEHVLINILSNAIKYAPNESTVTIRVATGQPVLLASHHLAPTEDINSPSIAAATPAMISAPTDGRLSGTKHSILSLSLSSFYFFGTSSRQPSSPSTRSEVAAPNDGKAPENALMIDTVDGAHDSESTEKTKKRRKLLPLLQTLGDMTRYQYPSPGSMFSGGVSSKVSPFTPTAAAMKVTGEAGGEMSPTRGGNRATPFFEDEAEDRNINGGSTGSLDAHHDATPSTKVSVPMPGMSSPSTRHPNSTGSPSRNPLTHFFFGTGTRGSDPPTPNSLTNRSPAFRSGQWDRNQVVPVRISSAGEGMENIDDEDAREMIDVEADVRVGGNRPDNDIDKETYDTASANSARVNAVVAAAARGTATRNRAIASSSARAHVKSPPAIGAVTHLLTSISEKARILCHRSPGIVIPHAHNDDGNNESDGRPLEENEEKGEAEAPCRPRAPGMQHTTGGHEMDASVPDSVESDPNFRSPACATVTPSRALSGSCAEVEPYRSISAAPAQEALISGSVGGGSETDGITDGDSNDSKQLLPCSSHIAEMFPYPPHVQALPKRPFSQSKTRQDSLEMHSRRGSQLASAASNCAECVQARENGSSGSSGGDGICRDHNVAVHKHTAAVAEAAVESTKPRILPITISVIDQGVGISKEDQKLLFGAFQQIKASEQGGQGTGLGLAICKYVVEKHGGTLDVDSDRGRGCTFSFTIPFELPPARGMFGCGDENDGSQCSGDLVDAEDDSDGDGDDDGIYDDDDADCDSLYDYNTKSEPGYFSDVTPNPDSILEYEKEVHWKSSAVQVCGDRDMLTTRSSSMGPPLRGTGSLLIDPRSSMQLSLQQLCIREGVNESECDDDCQGLRGTASGAMHDGNEEVKTGDGDEVPRAGIDVFTLRNDSEQNSKKKAAPISVPPHLDVTYRGHGNGHRNRSERENGHLSVAAAISAVAAAAAASAASAPAVSGHSSVSSVSAHGHSLISSSFNGDSMMLLHPGEASQNTAPVRHPHSSSFSHQYPQHTQHTQRGDGGVGGGGPYSDQVPPTLVAPHRSSSGRLYKKRTNSRSQALSMEAHDARRHSGSGGGGGGDGGGDSAWGGRHVRGGSIAASVCLSSATGAADIAGATGGAVRATGPLRVLIVDDTSSNRKMLALLLRKRGIECTMVENGQLAVHAVATAEPLRFDIIFMDRHMPVMNGMKATQKLREMGFAGLIIGLTGASFDDEIQAFLDSGTDIVCCKPFTSRAVTAVLKHVRRKGTRSRAGRKWKLADGEVVAKSRNTTQERAVTLTE